MPFRILSTSKANNASSTTQKERTIMNIELETILTGATVDTTAAAAVVAKSKKGKKTEAAQAAAPAAAPAEEAKREAPALTVIEGDLKDMIKALDPAIVTKTVTELNDNVQSRIDYETKNGGTERKRDLLKGYQKRLVPVAIAEVFAALGTDTNFMNKGATASGKLFNVYAVDKVADMAAALAGAGIRNKVNNAIVRSLFACRAAGLEFNGTLAAAAVSDKVRIGEHIKKVLVRHSVSESTVDTQLSSTMTALRIFGVVENIGSRNEPIWRLTDTPATRALEAQLAA